MNPPVLADVPRYKLKVIDGVAGTECDNNGKWLRRGDIEPLLRRLEEERDHEQHEKETVSEAAQAYKRWASSRIDQLEATVARLEAENKELALERHHATNRLTDAIVRAEADEAALASLREYAQHTDECSITLCVVCRFGPLETHTPCKCTCGLDEILVDKS